GAPVPPPPPNPRPTETRQQGMTVVSSCATGAPKTAFGPATSDSRVIVRSINGASAALVGGWRVMVVVIVSSFPELHGIACASHNPRTASTPHKPERQRAYHKLAGDQRPGCKRRNVA